MIYLAIAIIALAIVFVIWLIFRGRKPITIIEVPSKPDPSGEISRIRSDLHDRKQDIKDMSRDSAVDRANRILRRRRGPDGTGR